MRALILNEPGPVESLCVSDVSDPQPGPGEIRVQVAAVGLNPVDYKLAGRGNPNWCYPHVLGLDVAGTVDALGEGVTEWRVGDRVFYHGDLSKPGGFAELAITTAHTTAAIPDSVSFVDAAALPFDEGLSAYLKAFAVGQRDLQLAPARPADPNEAQPVYVFDDAGRAWLADVAERMTPLPIAPIGSDLPSVRLLDGTGDRRIAQEALDVVVRLSEVEIFGNATEFGLSQTTVSYHDPAGADAAADLASSLGGLAQFDPRPDDPVDLTVVIGTDWEAP